MEQYGRIVVLRWAWALIGALVGASLGVLVGVLGTTTYSSSVVVHVGARTVAGHQDLAYATLVGDQVVPSVEALATSGSVLQEVADRVGLPHGAADLGGRVTLIPGATSDVFTLQVADPQPARAATAVRAWGDVLAGRAGQLLAGSTGPLVSVQVLGAPSAPSRPARHLAQDGMAGAAAGAALAVVLSGLVELTRPRVRGRRDVAPVSSAAVLSLPLARPPGAPVGPLRGTPERSEQLALLRWRLRADGGDGPSRRIAVTGPAGDSRVTGLTGELQHGARPLGDMTLLAVPDAATLSTAGPVDGVLVVTDARSTTRRELRATVEMTAAAGLPVLAVVVDGLLPARAGWPAWLRAGVRGDGRWAAETRGEAERDADGRHGIATRLIAVLALVAVGFTRPLPFGLSTGLVVTTLLLPVWLPTVRRTRAAIGLLVLAGLSLVSGVLLAWSASSGHGFERHDAVWTAVLVASSVCGAGLILWARTVLSLPVIGVSFGIGALLTGLDIVAGSPNPWKFDLSFPVTVIVLSIVTAWRKPAVTVTALAVLGGVDVLNDYRSALGFCGLAALLVLWQLRDVRRTRRAPWWAGIPLVAAVVAAGYSILTRLLVSGVLGSELQKRTVAQIGESGSLLLSGRPEWTATWALMRHRPLGFGLGTLPTPEDVAIAKQGLAVTRVPTVDGYLEHYMLNGGYELHSIVADLWAALGPVGILLGLTMGALVVRGLAVQLGARSASGLVCFLVPLGLWNLAFGPLPSDVSALTLGLGLLLVTRTPHPAPAVAAPPARTVLEGAPAR